MTRPFATAFLFLIPALGAAATILHAQTIQGRVLDAKTNGPVSGVSVLALDTAGASQAAGTPGATGEFRIDLPAPGQYRLRFRVPGYRSLISEAWTVTSEETRNYDLLLAPVPPDLLDTIIVEGKTIPKRLAGFYRRRGGPFGTFVTRDGIERLNPSEMTDIIRRFNTFIVLADPNSARGYLIVGRGQRTGRRSCSPDLWLDGGYLGNADEVDLDTRVGVGSIEAIEMYASTEPLPDEFKFPRRGCGAIVLWTRALARP
jgi:hypothetical protein